MKKLSLALALLICGFLSANATRVAELPRGSIAGFLGKYILTINHNDSTFDFYRLDTESPPSLIKASSFPILDESGEVIDNVESFKAVKVTPDFLDLTGLAVTEDTKTLIIGMFRDRIREGKKNITTTKSVILNVVLDESDNVTGLQTIAVLDLGPQPRVRI